MFRCRITLRASACFSNDAVQAKLLHLFFNAIRDEPALCRSHASISPNRSSGQIVVKKQQSATVGA